MPRQHGSGTQKPHGSGKLKPQHSEKQAIARDFEQLETTLVGRESHPARGQTLDFSGMT